jgi:hypothetical protein
MAGVACAGRRSAETSIDLCRAKFSVAAGRRAIVIDLLTSRDYRKAHSRCLVCHARAARSRAREHERARHPGLTSEDGVLAGLAVSEALALAQPPVRFMRGGNAAWRAAGLPLSDDPHMADEPLDVWLKPYERPGDTAGAMREYLSWEVDLLSHIARDGSCGTLP